MYRYYIHEAQHLAALVGVPAACVWATVSGGYSVGIWRTYPDGEETCIASRDGLATFKAAVKWAKSYCPEAIYGE